MTARITFYKHLPIQFMIITASSDLIIAWSEEYSVFSNKDKIIRISGQVEEP